MPRFLTADSMREARHGASGGRARRVAEGRAATARIAIDIRVTQAGYPGIGRATTGLVEALLRRDTPHRLLLLHDTDRCLPASLAATLRPPHALLPIGSALRSARDQFELPLRLRQARADLYHSPYYAMALRPGCPYLLQVFDYELQVENPADIGVVTRQLQYQFRIPFFVQFALPDVFRQRQLDSARVVLFGRGLH